VTATAIGTLCLTGAAADTPAFRLRAARELAGADVSPPGLPPAAMLVVRRLFDPLPRSLAGGELRVRPDPAWERAMRERLAIAAGAAARVDAHGAVAPGAAAVLFADPAEVLACAVRERVRGRLAACWWWRSLRQRLRIPAEAGRDAATGGRDPAPLLAACPREVPAALARLECWGDAAAVAAALSPEGAARVLVALVAAHDLARDLASPSGPAVQTVESSTTGGSDGGLPRREPEAAVGRASGPLARHRAPPSEPWRPWLPAALDAGIRDPEVRCLFGIALGLAATPHRLRSPETTREARRWWRAVAEERSAARATTTAERPDPSGGSRDATDAERDPATGADGKKEARRQGPADGPTTGARAAHDDDAGRGPRGQPPAETPAIDVLADRADGPRPPDRPPTVATLPARVEPPAASVARSAGVHAEVAEGRLVTERRHRDPPLPGRRDERGGRRALDRRVRALPGEAIETGYGGVLYLIHVLLALDLPDAFERGWRLASTAGAWGTLDLVARGLLGESFGRAGDDRVWGVLGGLAGWPAAARSGRGRSRPAYRIPADWPAKLGDPLGRPDSSSRPAWSAARGRLRLWSRTVGPGFLVAEVARDATAPSRQARRELARVAPGAAAGKTLQPLRRPAASAPLATPPPLPAGCPPRLGAWLAAALPAIRRRLLLALVAGGGDLARALATPPGERHDPVARALAVPGRLHVTSSHVDLVLPLSAADLAVRRAGLDCNPGWLPAFGRVVSFHFE